MHVYVSIVPDTMKPFTALSLLQHWWVDTLNYRLHKPSQPRSLLQGWRVEANKKEIEVLYILLLQPHF